jgi:hypothetical protein
MRSLALLPAKKIFAPFLPAAQPVHLNIVLYHNVRLKNTLLAVCRRVVISTLTIIPHPPPHPPLLLS